MSSGVCFRLSLRCCCTFILHMESNPLTWFDLEKHTSEALSWQNHSKNQTLRCEELAPGPRDRTVSRQRSGEVKSKNSSAALKVPKSRLASITLEQRKSGTSRTLPSTGCLSRRSDGKSCPQQPKELSVRAPERLHADGPASQHLNGSKVGMTRHQFLQEPGIFRRSVYTTGIKVYLFWCCVGPVGITVVGHPGNMSASLEGWTKLNIRQMRQVTWSTEAANNIWR